MDTWLQKGASTNDEVYNESNGREQMQYNVDRGKFVHYFESEDSANLQDLVPPTLHDMEMMQNLRPCVREALQCNNDSKKDFRDHHNRTNRAMSTQM